jgi:hypothetical protein
MNHETIQNGKIALAYLANTDLSYVSYLYELGRKTDYKRAELQTRLEKLYHLALELDHDITVFNDSLIDETGANGWTKQEIERAKYNATQP